MTKIELIYDSGCPNVDAARANLKQALANLPFENDWTEWERTAPSAPAYVQRYGSPTVLIDRIPIGKEDVDEAGNSCSIYFNKDGEITHVPSVNQIRSAIQEVSLKRKPRPILGIVSSIGSSILAVIPVISCPLCWPAYTALLSTIGIGFFNYSPYLIPFLIGLIGFVSFLMWRDYRIHKRILPFLLSLIGGACVVIGKIIYSNDPLMYAGITGLIVAGIVNIFLVKKINKKLLQPRAGCSQEKEKKNE